MVFLRLNFLSYLFKHQQPAHRRARLLLVLPTVVSLLGACAVPTAVISDRNLAEWNSVNLPQIFAEQEPLTGSLSISEAIARAIKYNLQKRVAVLQEELSLIEANISTFDIYPSITTGVRLSGRSNPPVAFSKNDTTGEVSKGGNTYSSSIYPLKTDVDVQFSWNLLNMGVSVVKAIQASDRAKISTERRRKAIQEIVNEVQISFWQAAAAQRLAGDVERLLPRVDELIAVRRQSESSGAQDPLSSLADQRTLLELKRQLLAIHNALVNAKATLANLIGIRVGTDFELNIAESGGLGDLELGIDALERYGLNNRPELVEEAYAERIASNDAITAILSTLPSISFSAGYNYSDDDLLKNKSWANYGLQLTHNLLNLAKGITTSLNSSKRVELIKHRRLAVAMSVLTQIRLSWLNYWQSREQYQAAVDYSNVENRILQQVQSLSSAGSTGELELIRSYMNALIGELNKDLAYADLRAALNRVLISAGVDPSPEALSLNDVDSLAQQFEHSLASWQDRLIAGLHWNDSQNRDHQHVVTNAWRGSDSIQQLLAYNAESEDANDFKWQFQEYQPTVTAADIPLAPVSAVIATPLRLLSPELNNK